MSTRDPLTAPRRTDLPFLRTRSRPRTAAPVAPPARPTAAPVQAPATASLDLGPSGSTSLDLSPAPQQVVRRPRPERITRRLPAPRRAPSGQQTILNDRGPTVVLDRLQTGIGKLRIEAAVSPQVGDLRLGCAYQLRGGATSTVQRTGGNRFAPSDGKRPVLQAQLEQYETIAVDLRRSQELERLAIYAYSESRAPLAWAGTLVVRTFGGAAIELPLEMSEHTPVAVLMTVYNVDHQLVLRHEMEPFGTSVRAACLAYGYDRITWLDDWTPIR